MKKETNIIVPVIFGILAFIFASSIVKAIISNLDTKKEEYKMPATFEQSLKEKADQLDSSELRKSIVDGCLEEASGQIAYCNCAADYILSKMSNTELVTVGIDYENNKTMTKESADIMADAVYSCLDKYQQ